MMIIRRLLFALLMTFCVLSRAADLKAVITAKCFDCHNDDAHKGGLSIGALHFEITAANAKDWLKILEQIERGTMPPATEEPWAAAERRAAVLELEGKLVDQARALPTRSTAVLRRLNRTEYRQTVRDLLHLQAGNFDPTREFPEDTRVHGFSSNGEKLVTSSFLLRQYMEAAEKIVERAVHFEAKPVQQHWALLPPFDRTTRGFNYAEADHYRKAKQVQPFQTIYERLRDSPQMGYHPIDELNGGMKVGGWYDIRIEVEAKFRYADLDPKDSKLDLRPHKFPSIWDPSEPIRLSLFTGTLEDIDPDNKEALATASMTYQAGQRELATWDLPDDKKSWVSCRVWLDRGQFPRLGFPNGPSDSNNRLFSYFTANKDRLLNAEQRAKFDADQPNNANVFMWFESPRIQISKIEVDGPINATWPPESHRVIFGEQAFRSEAAEAVLLGFATRAWRRPATAAEIAPIVKIVREAEKEGLTAEAAIQEGIKGILCSPGFLYREEKSDGLTDLELASRLSYFLWSSMPDEALLTRAENGELMKPGVLREEALRLLSDARSDAFVDEFLNGWLALRKLGTMAPDPHKFSVYYSDELEPAMRTETRLFFRQLLNSNGPIERFLNSDYAFVSRRLAKLYGLDPKLVEAAQGQAVEGLRPQDLVDENAPSMGFARVKLPDSRRGGLLGQASILTLTANGVDTSPVIRGVWLLDNILGAPPSPPPPNVPTIEPDIRGAKTIREQLQKHQESATCKSCHKQIDPPGFALENFDAIGRWRGHYVNNKTAVAVDASGQFGASKFKDIVGFKQELMNRREQFARCLVEKLLIHALGRELDVRDRPAVRGIVETAEKDGYRLRDLVVMCVESEIFRRK